MVKCVSCVADFGRDGILINWIINRSGKNLYGLHSGRAELLFGGDIFYPYTNVLAYSDMFMLTALWAYPLGRWWGDLRIVSGLVMVVGQAMTMTICYFWWRRITKSNWGAVVGTVAFGLSQIRFEYQVHMQMWNLVNLLTAGWLMAEWVEGKYKKTYLLILGAGLLGVQVWESLLPVYFSAVMVAAKIVVDRRPPIKQLVLAATIFLVVAFLPLRAYWQVSREFNFQRTIRDAANGGMSVDDLWGKFASPGLYVLLGVVGMRIVGKQKLLGMQERQTLRWLGLILITSLILALGPTLKWGGKTVKLGGKIPIALPYAAAYYLVPGMDAFRTPSRWIFLTGWAASGIIAVGFSNIQLSGLKRNLNLSNWKRKKRLAGAWGLLLTAVVGGTAISKVRRVPGDSEVPMAYRWLANQPGEVMVILPMYADEREIERLPYSYVHRKKTINGFSGFYPPERMKTVSNQTADELRELGVNWVVVEKREAIIEGLKLEYADKEHEVFKI